MARSEAGFTLLEMLVVLTVLSVCFGAAMIPLRAMTSEVSDQQFFNQLEHDLFEAQTYAIVNNSNVVVTFFEDKQNKYVISTFESPKKTLMERAIPDRFIYGEKGLSTITFFRSGTTSTFGTVYFTTNEKNVKLVFLLGRGRFYFFKE